MERVAACFAHVGMAIALHHASTVIAAIYGVNVNLQVPLPPYPGVVVQRPQLVLV